MAKNILVISSSLRARSNSEALADAFIEGAQAAGNKVEKVTLKGKKLGFCLGCLSCVKTHKCVIKDDAAAIVEKMLHADVIAFATPVYYYEMSGQLKTMLDRANPLFTMDYAFRDIYVLTSAADNEKFTPERTVSGIIGWIDCFPKAKLAGSVFAGGVTEMGEITGHPALKEAYAMGKKA